VNSELASGQLSPKEPFNCAIQISQVNMSHQFPQSSHEQSVQTMPEDIAKPVERDFNWLTGARMATRVPMLEKPKQLLVNDSVLKQFKMYKEQVASAVTLIKTA
jgi:hypothetical protein